MLGHRWSWCAESSVLAYLPVRQAGINQEGDCMRIQQTLLASAISLVIAPVVMAGEIQQIELTNFGPLAPDTTFRTIYDRDVSGGTAGAMTYGEIGWDALKAVDPGIIVYNNVPIYGNPATQIIADCVMAPRLPSLAGTPDKQCNDGFQTHKRYKMNATGVGAIDLVFTVKNVENENPIVDRDGNPVATDQDITRNIYRMIGKLNNHTTGRLGGFRVELGYGLGAGFTNSTVGDGLLISLHEEEAVPGTASVLGDNDMAEFPGGLFYGPADDKHDWGFFDSSRAYLAVDTATLAIDEDSFVTTTLSANYSGLFGEWLPIDWVPTGWFFDHDGNPATDAIVTAWNDGTQWIQYLITDDVTGARATEYPDAAQIAAWEAAPPTVWDDDGDAPKVQDTDPDQTLGGTLYATWNPETELYDLAAGGTLTNDAMTTLIDGSATLERRAGYQQGPIEDLANVNLNYYIEIADATTWPGYNAVDQTATFTLRITPLAAASNDVPAWVPVASSGGGSGCALGTGRSGFDPLLPGMALAGLGWLALRRRAGGSAR